MKRPAAESGGRRSDTLTFWQRTQVFLIAALGGACVWLLNSTLRYSTVGEEHLRRARELGPGFIYAFWHNQIFCALYFFRHQDIAVMISEHFDGEYSARIARWLGYCPARGSSSRRALNALRAMARHLRRGGIAAFAVDGPRGPRHTVKNGPLWLSARTGCAIVPFRIEPDSFWELDSWDRFRIPKPFSRAVVRFGEPILAEGDDAAWMERFQQSMDRL